jgi:hypothetical protein
MRLFVALGAAVVATTVAVVALAAIMPATKAPAPAPGKPVVLTAKDPLVPRLVPTEVYTRPASAPAPAVTAAPARVLLAAPFPTVATVAKVEPPPVPVLEPPREPGPEPKVRPGKRERRAELGTDDGGNICTRHGLRKVYTNGGRSWRCRR